MLANDKGGPGRWFGGLEEVERGVAKLSPLPGSGCGVEVRWLCLLMVPDSRPLARTSAPC